MSARLDRQPRRDPDGQTAVEELHVRVPEEAQQPPGASRAHPGTAVVDDDWAVSADA